MFRYLICVVTVALVAMAAVLCGGVTRAAEAGAVVASAGSMTTAEHVRGEAWWPTKAVADQGKFVGSAACARCHAEISATQGASQMAHTLMPAGRADALHRHLAKGYESGPYRYTVQQDGARVNVRVADGKGSRSAVLEWAFGSGEMGQSYLWQQGETYRETRFNYFETLDGFDQTPGRLRGAPVSLEMAVGRPVEAFEAKTCFACHTTNISADLKTVVPGVGCEACHGPGAEHIAAMDAKAKLAAAVTAELATPADLKSARGATSAARFATASATTPVSGQAMNAVVDTRILSPHDLSPVQQVDLCGSCHSTPWDVRVMGAAGPQTVRFPAYRLEKSRCWGVAGDDRVTCTACHDPHARLERSAEAYDAPCLACHVTKLHPVKDERHVGAACPVAATKCVTCHMPKVEVPEMHYKFTDHMIRIARGGGMGAANAVAGNGAGGGSADTSFPD